ncbi:MAG: hypothetical protein AAF639_44620 [Chloroflexota bacterium]
MAQLENLIELIRTVNEVYFITAPERVRAAYILVDDTIELALKTHLHAEAIQQQTQCKKELKENKFVVSKTERVPESYFSGEIDIQTFVDALGLVVNEESATTKIEEQINAGKIRPEDKEVMITRLLHQPREKLKAFNALLEQYWMANHWSLQSKESHVGFYSLVKDMRRLHPDNKRLNVLLEDIFTRHKNRNRMYHDHEHAGWIVSDKNCLQAICAMFELMELLFDDFQEQVQRYSTVGCQIAVLQLKLAMEESGNKQQLEERYEKAVKHLRTRYSKITGERAVEHTLIHNGSGDFFQRLRSEFQERVSHLQAEVYRIENLQKPRPASLANLNTCRNELSVLKPKLQEIEKLLGGLA